MAEKNPIAPLADAQAAILDNATDPFVRTSKMPAITQPPSDPQPPQDPPVIDYVKVADAMGKVPDPFTRASDVDRAISQIQVGNEGPGGTLPQGNRWGHTARAYNLWLDYGLMHDHTAKKVKDMIYTGQEAQKLPWAWKAATGGYLRLTADEFREMYWFSAVFLDAAFRGEAPGFLASGKQNAFNFIEVPVGHYLTNVNLPIPRAGMTGMGNYRYWGNGVDHGQATTSFQMTSEWIDKHEDIIAFSGPNMLDNGDGAYSPSNHVRLLHIDGPGIIQDGRRRIGIAFSQAGEGSSWDLICASSFDIGIAARGATPMSGGTCSVFDNRIAGVGLLGTSQATVDLKVVSGDRNGSLVRMLPGYGLPAGGKLHVGLLKEEDANRQGGGKFGSQVCGWFAGQFAVVIDMVSNSSQDRINDAVFVVDSVLRSTNGHGQSSMLRATGLGENFHSLLHNLDRKTRRKAQVNHKAWSFEWWAEDDSFHTNTPGLDRTALPAGSVALGSLPNNNGRPVGKWDYGAGTPARNDAP